ncbi:hypothetical protein [Dasineura jujubifolia toursvirus 2a]|nr:hypothetical protein [Dasineura jujubifolia toursvirus 2a]
MKNSKALILSACLILSCASLTLADQQQGYEEQESYVNEPKCNICSRITWVPSSTPTPITKNQICRVYKDRYIIGEVQLDEQSKTMCKIPYYNVAENNYDFDLLRIDDKDITSESSGLIAELPKHGNAMFIKSV